MIAVNYSLDEYIPYSSAILHFVKPNIILKFVDRIIDLGPDGGAGGGEIVAEGTPEDVCKVKRSLTAKYLKEVLAKDKKIKKAKE